MSQIADSKSSLPQSWLSLPIGHVSHVVSGGTPPSKDKSCFTTPGDGIPWLTPADLSNNKAQHISHGSRDLTKKGLSLCSAQILPTGSVLFSSRAPIGYVAIAQNPLSTNQGFKSFALPKEIDSRFIYYQLRHLKAVAEALATGTTFKELSGTTAARIPIALAPINEQRRIADKLDRVLARVDTANEHLSRVAPLIKRFRQSVLAAAFKGKLTEEFRKQEELTPIDETVKRSPEIPRPNRYNSRTDAVIPGDFALSVNQSNMTAPDGWKWLPMVDVARMESGHTPSRSFPEYWHGNIPWIGIVDARLHHTSTIEDTIQHTNNLGLENSAARLLPEGTVCVSRTASVGYVVKMGKPMATSQDFVNWVCGPAVSPDWLKWLFVAEGAALYRFGKGSTHTTIYFPEWLSLHVALPPLEEQSEIVRRVEKLFAFADRLEERLSQAQAAVQKLTPALLAKAFRGELVPQDPNDEPASELLKRLQESRANDTKPRRARKPRATSAGEPS